MDSDVQIERLKELVGTDLGFRPEEFDPANDTHLDAVAVRLLERFHGQNDVEALSSLFELTQDRLGGMARQIVAGMALALDPDDLVASFFEGIFVDLRRRPPRVKRFLGLAYRAMRNQALNLRRNGSRERRWHLVYQRSLAAPADPARVTAEREQVQRLWRLGLCLLAAVSQAFHALTERDRRVLLLRELEGCSYRDVATALDVPEEQIGTVIRRARKRLEDRIGRALASPRAGPILPERAVS